MRRALGAEDVVQFYLRQHGQHGHIVQSAPQLSAAAAASLHLGLRPVGSAGLTRAWQALPGPCSSPGNSTPAPRCLLTPHVAARTTPVKVTSSLSDAVPHSWPPVSSGTDRHQEHSASIHYASGLPPGWSISSTGPWTGTAREEAFGSRP